MCQYPPTTRDWLVMQEGVCEYAHMRQYGGTVEITRKQLERMLIAHHRIRPDKEETFRSRIKTLQRMGFPPGTNVGRGPKVGYSAEHLLMLISVLELQQIGLPADRAIKTLEAGWRDLKGGYGAAYELQDRFPRDQVIDDEKIFGWIHVRALSEMQLPPPNLPFEVHIPVATVITASALQQPRSNRRMSYSFVLLDLSDIVRSVCDACLHDAGIDVLQFGTELLQWFEDAGYVAGGHPLQRKKVKH